jgi:hypothetical protein
MLNDVQFLHNRARVIVTEPTYTTEQKLAKVIDLLNATADALDQPFIELSKAEYKEVNQ